MRLGSPGRKRCNSGTYDELDKALKYISCPPRWNKLDDMYGQREAIFAYIVTQEPESLLTGMSRATVEWWLNLSVEEFNRQIFRGSDMRIQLLKSERFRQQTFMGECSDIPHQRGLDLAAAGFYKNKRFVKCLFCPQTLQTPSRTNSNPMAQPQHSRDCPFVRDPAGCGNIAADKPLIPQGSTLRYSHLSKDRFTALNRPALDDLTRYRGTGSPVSRELGAKLNITHNLTPVRRNMNTAPDRKKTFTGESSLFNPKRYYICYNDCRLISSQSSQVAL